MHIELKRGDNMKISQLLAKGYGVLKEHSIDSYIIDTQLLLCKVLNVEKLFIMMNRDLEVTSDTVEAFLKLIELRKNKMPVKYILGHTEFMGLEFMIKEGVLIPRPDTEILVEEAMKIIEENKFDNICDVCCGSGAIGLSLAYHTKASKVSLYDISDTALEVTGHNIKKLSLDGSSKVYKSDLLTRAIEEKLTFDMVVSNPPYIRTEIIPTLMEDVKSYEPYIALWGGDDGLIFYRKITSQCKEVLNSGGYLAFEIGYDQRVEVMEILKSEGYINVYSIEDLSGNPRVVIGKLP
jgi:release factor glutamine methyltransferase